MIPLLIITLIKYFHTREYMHTGIKFNTFVMPRLRLALLSFLVILFVIISLAATSQTQQANYAVTKGGDEIGWLRLEKNTTGTTTKLSLVSEIKTRVVFLITISAKDSSTFENKKMTYSSQLRKTNGTTKLYKQTSLVAGKYEFTEDGEKEKLSIPFIGINMLSLYFQEPLGIHTVYCDLHKCFVSIAKTGDGGYKVKRPDGNSSTFYYSEGTCTKVIICQSFYTVAIVLNQ